MLAILSAFLATTASTCISVPGADALWRPQTRWVIVGEMHGTNETPDAFANLACLAAASGRPVTVALEYPADDQPVIDTFLSSDGDARAIAALKMLPVFTAEMQDGRGSVAFVRLWDRLRRMKQAGQIERIVASDVGRATPGNLDRNAVMARNWIAIPTSVNGIVMALVGNFHAIRTQIDRPDQTIRPAGSLMPADRTVTINVVGDGGEAWNCQSDGCKAHANGGIKHTPTGLIFSVAADRRWDATLELGVPTTAAGPAVVGMSPQRKASTTIG